MEDMAKILGDFAGSPVECTGTMIKACLKEADALVGVSDFPALCHEIVHASSILDEDNDSLNSVFFRRAYIFFADRGRGYNAALKILQELLFATDLFSLNLGRDGIIPIECDSVDKLMPSDPEMNNKLQWENMIISIDFSSIPASLNNPKVQDFLIQLRDKTKEKNNILVFRLPYMEKEKAQAAVQMINWFFTTKSVFFQPLTDENILDMADIFFSTLGCQMEPDARDSFLELVQYSRENGFFYGSHTVRKLVDDVIAERLVKDCPDPVIRKADIHATPRYQEMCGLKHAPTTMKEVFTPLDNMVGMEAISRDVKGIVQSILYTRKTGQSAPSLHMVLTGNPGTGKTSVARVIAAALKCSGVLSVGKCVECTGADLVAKYVGQSAPQTRTVCQSAYGSVLFIDEAYTLASDKSNHSFGEEALAELISQMENHREDFVVIMAGYADDMEKMLSVNAGMKRRLAYRIDIPPCSSEQLYAIYMQQLRNRKKQAEANSFSLDWDASFEQCVEAYFYSIPVEVLSDKAFGNGGYARNLLEKTINQAVTRCSNDNIDHLEYNLFLTVEDFKRAAKQVKQI